MSRWRLVVLVLPVGICLALLLFRRTFKEPSGLGPVENDRALHPDASPSPLPAVSQDASSLFRSSDPPRVLGKIGSFSLTSDRIARRMAVDAIRSSVNCTPDSAVLGLLEEALKQEIARKRFGIAPSRASLEIRTSELEEDPTLAGTVRRLLKEVYGEDREKFIHEVIGPMVVESQLWERFSSDPQIHASSHMTASAFHSFARGNPQRFAYLNDKSLLLQPGFAGVSLEGARLSRNQIALVDAEAQGSFPPLQGVPIDRELLSRLPDGAIYPSVVETPQALRLIKRVRRAGSAAEVEVWTVPKKDYGTWLEEEARAIPHETSPVLLSALDSMEGSSWLSRAFKGKSQ